MKKKRNEKSKMLWLTTDIYEIKNKMIKKCKTSHNNFINEPKYWPAACAVEAVEVEEAQEEPACRTADQLAAMLRQQDRRQWMANSQHCCRLSQTLSYH